MALAARLYILKGGLMPFETITTSLDSGITVLTLSGNLTMGTQLQRFEWMLEELAKKSPAKIVLDLSGVPYVDSASIGVLVGCSGVAKTLGGQMRLSGLTDRVAKTLKMGGVDGVLNIDPTRDAAVASLSSNL